MLVPVSWLNEYIDIDVNPNDLAHRLTMAGIEVGEVVVHGGWDNCYVGHVLEVNKHPNADRLNLCRVTTNNQEVEIVCGAPNVAAGQNICFAQVGATLHSPRTGQKEILKPANIRGVTSQGMICSELELGIGDSHEGIIVLPEDAPIGMPLDDYLGETILDLELTPNRVDCLSILGVAHEIGAILKKPIKEPSSSYIESSDSIGTMVSAEVSDKDLCCRYTGSVITGVAIGESPEWIKDRLSKVGVRSINNVVDITNYVMIEYNQPLHAFDLDKVQNQTIIVRRAQQGEELTTLDGVTRKLTPDNLVIADSESPIGLGGVIGGQNSEIENTTRTIFLESATFNDYNNRSTAESFQLRTEATVRFEKGLSPQLAPIALRRACSLIQEIAGGQVCQGIIDINSVENDLNPTVDLNMKRLQQVLGMELDQGLIIDVLTSLGMDIQRTKPDGITASIPYWRNDIHIEEDLIEEIVRIIGYDEVPTIPIATPIPHRPDTPLIDLKTNIRTLLSAVGFQETISYPLISLESLENANQLVVNQQPIHVANPMSVGQEYLRTTLRPSLVQTLGYNQLYSNSETPLKLFELGRIFIPRANNLPEEKEMVSGIVTGPRSEPSWLVGSAFMDFYDLKGMVHATLESIGLQETYEHSTDPGLQDGKCASIVSNGIRIGVIGELLPEIRTRFDLRDTAVFLFDLDLEAIIDSLGYANWNFRTLSRFPSATRDLALIMPTHISAQSVVQTLHRNKLVTKVEIFDVYSGENIPEDTKSLALHLYFQSPDHTLTSDEVNKALKGILINLEKDLGAVLRSI
ncbi:MAG: phenylalanine--tRNA ligase subunit beta [Chloroflexota bacterium]|nr:phenylalanine--tRNA ligase subunit beta [Chloroflexota bacterium]